MRHYSIVLGKQLPLFVPSPVDTYGSTHLPFVFPTNVIHGKTIEINIHSIFARLCRQRQTPKLQRFKEYYPGDTRSELGIQKPTKPGYQNGIFS